MANIKAKIPSSFIESVPGLKDALVESDAKGRVAKKEDRKEYIDYEFLHFGSGRIRSFWGLSKDPNIRIDGLMICAIVDISVLDDEVPEFMPNRMIPIDPEDPDSELRPQTWEERGGYSYYAGLDVIMLPCGYGRNNDEGILLVRYFNTDWEVVRQFIDTYKSSDMSNIYNEKTFGNEANTVWNALLPVVKEPI